MASSVFYKFSSRRDESRVSFDGTGISVFDLKRDIILANNMGKANDFDLYIYDSASKQEYKDDSEIIPRSSYVIVKRLPASRPGKGKASMYIAGAANVVPTSEPVSRNGSTWHKGALSKRFDGKDEAPQRPPTAPTAPTPVASSVTKGDEAAAMAAMFQAQTANWEETQEKMSHAPRIYNNPRGTGFSRGGKPHSVHQPYQVPDRPLPPSYVCYRCGQKGHWIKDCPTNNDREYDNKPRIKRTTGIPRSMLKAVENPVGAQIGQGVMVTPEGGYVVAQPDIASWQKQVSRTKALTAADVRERVPTDASLVCSIDNKLFRDAVKTPCCGTLYCEECIQTHLLERDFICPNCAKKIASLDELAADKPMRTQVTDYIEKAIETSKTEAEEETKPTTDDAAQQEEPNLEQDFYTDQQPGVDVNMQEMLVNSIPQLQAQISQISVMLQNASLPMQVRQTTEMQYQQLQMQLQQAQTFSAALATIQQQQQIQQQVQNANGAAYNNMAAAWSNPFVNQQPAGQDSAYQRLPVNNRRRNLKRERPSDFLEVGGEPDNKVARYWE
ncbi:DWNN domain-containing protein [Desarmillaria tabescens]|uniref:DWNN domain-containing protein n=1 Tax=Armillaria tabescens TaxID=1929756 RepID=A0AA39NK06_ARMTA|nr:DWNN domain-containing protein [Desarmillaria tabescens]KAK0467056.1 DWNN domain-containing protein [Desarmillaria tabescens]